MKVVKLNGLKPEIVELDYNTIKEEMEICEKKGKNEKVAAYSKLLDKLDESSSSNVIEKEVNSIIDSNNERIKGLKKEIKILEKETRLLSQISQREVDLDVTMIIANL